ncbi:MAG: DUF190 domain-containing protein [Pseudomonadota bacterium]
MQDHWLRLYTSEKQKHAGKPLFEWLLETARKQGIAGGTVFRATAGFGRHGFTEETFFELAGELPMLVEFIASVEQVDALLTLCTQENLRLFYTRLPVAHGFTGT